MKYNRKFVIYSILVVAGLVSTELLLSQLFSYLSLANLFLWGILLVLLPIVSGVCFYQISNSKTITRKPLWSTLLIVGSVIVQITFHPVSHEVVWSISNTTWGKIGEYIDVYNNYPENVEYYDLISDSEPEMIAASVKYNETLPDRVAVIEVHERINDSDSTLSSFDMENTKWILFFENNDGEITHDEDQFSLEQREDSWWIVIDPNGSNPTDFLFTEDSFDISRRFRPGISEMWASGDYLFYITSFGFSPSDGAGELLELFLSSK